MENKNQKYVGVGEYLLSAFLLGLTISFLYNYLVYLKPSVQGYQFSEYFMIAMGMILVFFIYGWISKRSWRSRVRKDGLVLAWINVFTYGLIFVSLESFLGLYSTISTFVVDLELLKIFNILCFCIISVLVFLTTKHKVEIEEEEEYIYDIPD